MISSTAWGTYPPLFAGSLVLFAMWWKWRKEKATVLRAVLILALPFFVSWGTCLGLERLGFVTVKEGHFARSEQRPGGAERKPGEGTGPTNLNPTSTVTGTSVVGPVRKLTDEFCEVHGLQLYEEKPRRVLYGLSFFGPNAWYPHPDVFRGGCSISPLESEPLVTILICDACVSGHAGWVSNFLAGVRR